VVLYIIFNVTSLCDRLKTYHFLFAKKLHTSVTWIVIPFPVVFLTQEIDTIFPSATIRLSFVPICILHWWEILIPQPLINLQITCSYPQNMISYVDKEQCCILLSTFVRAKATDFLSRDVGDEPEYHVTSVIWFKTLMISSKTLMISSNKLYAQYFSP
jgi:hypothetical protein